MIAIVNLKVLARLPRGDTIVAAFCFQPDVVRVRVRASVGLGLGLALGLRTSSVGGRCCVWGSRRHSFSCQK